MQRDPIDPFIRAALGLAGLWGREAGFALSWLGKPEALASAMVDGDANHRAHWRCAFELVKLCEAQSGRNLADLLRELALEPVGQDAERPGG